VIKSSFVFLVVFLAVQTVVIGQTIAEFVPQGATVVSPGTPVTFSINIDPEAYTNFIMVIGTNAAGIEFEYDPEWTNYFSSTHDHDTDTLFYTGDEHGVVVWSSKPMLETYMDASASNLLKLGSITISTTGLAANSYWIKVDGNRDETSVLAYRDKVSIISGDTQIVVIPEPATLILFGFSLGVLTLRKAKLLT
jgi:hypothetical protein